MINDLQTALKVFKWQTISLCIPLKLIGGNRFLLYKSMLYLHKTSIMFEITTPYTFFIYLFIKANYVKLSVIKYGHFPL